MNFGKKYSNITVIMAMLHGVIIGVAAIAVIGFILANGDDKKSVAKIDEEIPASGPQATENEKEPIENATPLTLYAKQHGVFTTSASAATFMAADPSLATAAIIQANGQYFVWSAVGMTESEIMTSTSGESFAKTFTVNASSCQAIGAEKFQEVLKSDTVEKIKLSMGQENEEKTKEFNKQIAAITAFTNDLSVIRLHLLSQYSYSEDCVKISF